MTTPKWWQRAVFYQIYPRSFADGNGDGIGDFTGMISKLDYLKDLGVDAVWLSPHYPSPMADCGYDVADYTAVAPEYGTLDDFRRFLNGLHERGMYLILDLVLNHTSDQHPWFIESRSSKTNPKRDWYVWRPGKNGQPPNNWCATFGGPAWEYDPQTDEYYYHFFFKEQPDLNWHNPEVRQAMWSAVRFWLDMGVDGFRLDAIGTIFEDPAMPDHQSKLTLDDLYRYNRLAKTPEEQANSGKLWEGIFAAQHDQPGMHELVQELRAVINEYPDRVLVGETDDLTYYGSGEDELHLVFNFPLMRTRRLNAAWVRDNQQERAAGMPPDAWPCNTLGNHDVDRMISQFGDGINDAAIARVNLAILLFLRGTPFLYNGEEIGMTNTWVSAVSEFRDPLSPGAYELEMRLMGASPTEALQHAAFNGRDKCRTPLQWSNAPHGGFCPSQVKPWLPVNANYAAGVNVADQQSDSNSLWQTYRTLLHIRQQNPALIDGDYQPLLEKDTEVLAFIRSTASQRCLVIINTASEERSIRLKQLMQTREVIYTNTSRPLPDWTDLTLAPFEILLLALPA
ncbi:MAG TPA: alpha-glucosidase [Anaerolineaceae bacterium]|nr:alpha-glucosidase [Anaerolineaceae bacterium]